MERTWLIEAREAKGLSKSELAKRAKIVRSYISELEKGNKTPSGKLALRISRELGISMERFFEEEEERELVAN